MTMLIAIPNIREIFPESEKLKARHP